jgi:hypothetical protein
MPSVNVLTEIIINRPAQAVSAYPADPANAPDWYVNIESAEWKTPPPLRTGAQVGFTAHSWDGGLHTPTRSRISSPANGSSCERPRDHSPWKRPTPGH